MTRNAPGVVPAVYVPVGLITPPVAVYTTAGTIDDPSLNDPATENCAVPPGVNVTAAGDRTTAVTDGTVTGAVADTPSMLARMVAFPSLSAVTIPVVDTPT